MSDYKPTEHGGLRQDGQPGMQFCNAWLLNTYLTMLVDQRVQQDQFAHGKADPHEAGKKGGSASGGQSTADAQSNETGSDYKPSEHGGLRQDGQPDGRMKGNWLDAKSIK